MISWPSCLKSNWKSQESMNSLNHFVSKSHVNKFDAIQDRIKELEDRISSINDKNKLIEDVKAGQIRSEWTSTYEYWSKWEDVDDVKLTHEKEIAKIDECFNESCYNGHMFDHGEERKFFQQSEAEKLSKCEYHRNLGNYLYEEGNIIQAIENFRIAIAYYEYCFPETEEDQEYLDHVRCASWNNLSICYLLQSEYRLCIDYSTRVLQVQSENIKALYRRAHAYRMLDEYTQAKQDLLIALNCCEINPEYDTTEIKYELYCLKKQENQSILNDTTTSKSIFNKLNMNSHVKDNQVTESNMSDSLDHNIHVITDKSTSESTNNDNEHNKTTTPINDNNTIDCNDDHHHINTSSSSSSNTSKNKQLNSIESFDTYTIFDFNLPLEPISYRIKSTP